MMTQNLKRSLITVPALIVILVTVSSLVSDPSDADLPEEFLNPAAVPVSVEKVQLQSGFTLSRSYSGTVEPNRASRIGFEVQGRVVAVRVDEGDHVAAGQVLAELDSATSQALLERLEAQKRAAAARLAEAKAGPRLEEIDRAAARVDELRERHALSLKEAERAEFLLARGALSQAEADQAGSSAEVIEAQLRSAVRNLDELQSGRRPEILEALRAEVDQIDSEITRATIQLGQTRLRAPFAGRISERLVDEGIVVSPGQPALELVEDRLQARVPVPAELTRTLRLGNRLNLEISNRQVTGIISAIGPLVDRASRTVPILLAMPDSPSGIFPGEIARILVESRDETEGFWLPVEALTKGSRGLWSCFGLVPAGKGHQLERHDVEVLHSDGVRAFVRGTLRDGDLIVNSGTHRLVPGQFVSASPITFAELRSGLESSGTDRDSFLVPVEPERR